jgi:Na+/phosphate symporter
VTRIVKKFTDKESNEIAQDRKLLEFANSLSPLECSNFSIVLKLHLLGWEVGKIREHLQETVHKILEKQAEFEELVREENSLELHDAVAETCKKINNVFIERLKR